MAVPAALLLPAGCLLFLEALGRSEAGCIRVPGCQALRGEIACCEAYLEDIVSALLSDPRILIALHHVETTRHRFWDRGLGQTSTARRRVATQSESASELTHRLAGCGQHLLRVWAPGVATHL